MSKHKIAVISDTHSLLRPKVIEIIKGCELILHAGDIASKEIVEKIESFGKAYFVRGNADKGSWAEEIPSSSELELFGLKIFIIHNRKQIQEDVSDMDIVIYGHSHKYSEEYKAGVCYFNPGSCGPRRFHQEITMAILAVDEEEKCFSFEKVDCSPQPVDAVEEFADKDRGELADKDRGELADKGGKELSDKERKKIPDKDMEKLIKRIMRQMDAGKPLDEIARKNGIEKELVNQILQIYTTHQGIGVQGVLDRLDIWGK